MVEHLSLLNDSCNFSVRSILLKLRIVTGKSSNNFFPVIDGNVKGCSGCIKRQLTSRKTISDLNFGTKKLSFHLNNCFSKYHELVVRKSNAFFKPSTSAFKVCFPKALKTNLAFYLFTILFQESSRNPGPGCLVFRGNRVF